MKYLFAVILVLSLTSCGTITRLVNSTHKKEHTSIDSINHVKKDSLGTSKTVIVEKIDTSVSTKKDSAQVSTPLNNLLKGDTQTTDNGDIKVEVSYSPVTKKVTVKATTKPQVIPIRQDRTTTTTTQAKVSTTASNEVKKQTKINDTSKTVSVKKTGDIPWYLWIIGILALLIGAYFLYRKIML